MKKIIFIFVFLLGINNLYAQDCMWLKAYELAIKFDGSWSDWEDVNIEVKVDLDRDRITIYSAEVQIYRILEQIEAPHDSSGEQIAFKVIDQDGDIGRFRFRVQNNGTKQLYVDFNDVSWVYNVK